MTQKQAELIRGDLTAENMVYILSIITNEDKRREFQTKLKERIKNIGEIKLISKNNRASMEPYLRQLALNFKMKNDCKNLLNVLVDYTSFRSFDATFLLKQLNWVLFNIVDSEDFKKRKNKQQISDFLADWIDFILELGVSNTKEILNDFAEYFGYANIHMNLRQKSKIEMFEGRKLFLDQPEFMYNVYLFNLNMALRTNDFTESVADTIQSICESAMGAGFDDKIFIESLMR
ncbi:MAG: hypothetical protein MHPSP_001928, partial [Paramarteilia canceri]